MPIFCVTCQLGDTPTGVPGIGTAEVRQALPNVGEVIAGIGPCIQLAPFAWLVETGMTADAVMEQLWPQVLGEPERIAVFTVDPDATWRLHSGEASDPAVEWMGTRLKQ